jgi:uncharacterized protein (TIGR03663 family)
MTWRTAAFVACILAVAAGALAFRLPRLDQRPMHCDEANQAQKTADLWQTGEYSYNPDAHHGPSLYWLTLPSLWLGSAWAFADTTEATFRIVPVVFGAGTILLLLLLSDGLGRGATVAAGTLLAVSPGMVFFSRYYVQEMLLVFFTLAAIGCGWRHFRTRCVGWAAAAGASLGMMYVTKETWILSVAAMAAGLGLTAAWTRWRDGEWPAVLPYLRPGAVLAAVAAAAVVIVVFYSSFGTNWRGLLDSLLALGNWARRGSEGDIHAHPWYYYLQILVADRPTKWFFGTEGLIAWLSLVGCGVALWRFSPYRWEKAIQHTLSRSLWEGLTQEKPPTEAAADLTSGTSDLRTPTESAGERAPTPSPLALHRFLAYYTIVLVVLYSAIPYKTPWCLLNFLLGMALLAGIGARAMISAGRMNCAEHEAPRGIRGALHSPWVVLPLRAVVFILLVSGAVYFGWESYMLNFNPRLTADPRNPYVYAHTATDVLRLAERMERLAAISPDGHDMLIHVVTPMDCWYPLPWYFRRFNPDHVGYWFTADAWRKDLAGSPPPSVIVVTAATQDGVDAGLPAEYNQQMLVRFRPEVFASVYVREDLWEAFLAEQAARSAPD